MKRCVALSLVLALVASVPAAADSVFGFSYFGRDVFTGDARIEGRGGAGLAFTDSMNASVLQASQLADLERVTIGLSSRFSRVRAEDDLGTVQRLGMSVPAVRMGLPLPGHGGFGIGFVAKRATQWTVDRDREDLPVTGGIGYHETIEREGTLFDVPVQLGYRFFDRLAVGAGLHFRGGVVRFRYDVGEYDLERRAYTRYMQQEIRDDTYFGWAPEISLAVHDVGPVSVAGYWMPEYEADVDVAQSTVSDPTDQADSRTDTMPQRLGVGMRLQLPSRVSLGADFTFEEWSAYEGRGFTYDVDGNFDPAGAGRPMSDERVWRFGIERESARRGLRYSMPLRMGFYLRDWHYRVADSDLTEWGISVGSGLALRGGLARIDFSAGYSRTGSLDDAGVTESIWTIVVSVAGGERWY